MKDYIRDPKTGALFFNNPDKEREILQNREMERKIETMTDEINNLKNMLKELLAART